MKSPDFGAPSNHPNIFARPVAELARLWSVFGTPKFWRNQPRDSNPFPDSERCGHDSCDLRCDGLSSHVFRAGPRLRPGATRQSQRVCPHTRQGWPTGQHDRHGRTSQGGSSPSGGRIAGTHSSHFGRDPADPQGRRTAARRTEDVDPRRPEQLGESPRRGYVVVRAGGVPRQNGRRHVDPRRRGRREQGKRPSGHVVGRLRFPPRPARLPVDMAWRAASFLAARRLPLVP